MHTHNAVHHLDVMKYSLRQWACELVYGSYASTKHTTSTGLLNLTPTTHHWVLEKRQQEELGQGLGHNGNKVSVATVASIEQLQWLC